KYIVLSQLIGFLFSAGLIIFVIIYNLDNFLIYQALTLDFIIVFFLINFFYYKKTKFFFVKVDYNALKKIIIKSFPVLISSLGVILYMRIDQIMIKEMIGEYSLGIYSVSVRFIEIFHFIPKIIMISLLPILLTSKKYIIELQKLNSFIAKISIALILFLIFTSDVIITLIFSDIYAESILLTKILSLTIIFVFLGVVNEHWYISNNLQKYYAINVFSGAIINILLNYVLILKFGVIGASYATIITYFYIIFIFDYFNKNTRFLLKIKIKSII
ncbi:polysaccharide biosynthesis C-terminal domain-containing protein, partial [Candidatus Pelagibacter sp.]|nr:polysaccharide biosynthesis C-terminal domain-containing protein [Candidatus Pelagibacter sp.]